MTELNPDEVAEKSKKTQEDAELKAASHEENASDAERAEDAEDEKATQDEAAAEWKKKAAYLAAEIENMKKRFAREKSDFLKFANEDLLKRMLPVMDNLLLALSSVKEGHKNEEEKKDLKHSEKLFEKLQEGVEMTSKHFQQTLEHVGIEFIDSLGQEFNPEFHEAMGQTEDSSQKDGVVLSEFQKGVKLNGRVLRPAKVIVNKLSSPQEESETE